MLGSVGAQQEWNEVDRLNVSWKSHQLPPHTIFSSVHSLAELLMALVRYRGLGMKMSQSLGCKTRARAKGGAV